MKAPAAPGLLVAAARRCDAKVLLITLAVVALLHIAWTGETAMAELAPLELRPSRLIVHALMACCLVAAMLVADEAVGRGAGRWRAYALATLVGTALAATLQYPLHRVAGVPTEFELEGWTRGSERFAQPLNIFFDYLVWIVPAVALYAQRRSALAAAARMNALQLQRMELQRVTLEAKLKALQARVEPRFLIDVLSRIDRLYDGDAARGHRALDELITYLRAALPQLRDRSSTLEQELRLACAHLQLAHGCADDGGPRIETTIDDGLGQAHLPPMLLWPLLDLALGSAPSGLERSLSIAAHATSGRLRLEIRARGLAAPRVRALPQDLEERLHALYGARAALAFDAQRGDIVLEIPHETSDRADR